MSMNHAHRGAMALLCSLALQACLTDVDLEVDQLAVALPPPTNLQVEVTSPTGVRVTWAPSPGATRYLVQRGPTPGSETTIVSVLHPTTTWVYNHIPAGTHYCWVVRNLNASNETSGPSNEVCTSATTPGPATPADVTATLVSATRIRVTWSPVADATLYRVYAAAAPGAPGYVATVRHPSTAFSHTGLAAGTTYRYAVAAVNASGESAPSPIVTATTPGGTAPPPPTNVAATAVTFSRVQVTWDPVADATSYQVFAAIIPATPEYVGTVRAPATSYSHVGLTERTTYAYQVRAMTADGLSELSAIATATTPRSAPPVPPPTGECRSFVGTTPWCWVHPSPQSNPLRAIDRDTTFGGMRVIGDRGAVLRWTSTSGWISESWAGLTWSSGPAQLWRTWAIAGGMLLDGTSNWQAVTGVPDPRLVGGPRGDRVYVYNATPPSLYRRVDNGWQVHPMPAAGFEPIAMGGSGDSEAMRVVARDGRIARWSGVAWAMLSTGIRPANDAVVIGDRMVVLAQDSGIALWNGSSWTTRTPPVPGPWLKVAASSLTDVWVARAPDASGRLRRYRYDGTTWTGFDRAGETSEITDMLVGGTTSAWATLSDGTLDRWTGGPAWERLTTGDDDVTLTAGTDDDDVWMVIDDDDRVVRSLVTRRWNGTTWQDIVFPFQPAANDDVRLNAMWAAAPDDAWLAGGSLIAGDTARALFHWDGDAWSRLPALGSEDGDGTGFTAIWGAAANDVYAVAATALYHYDGVEWTVVADVPGGTDVFGSSASDVTVLDGATVWRWDGTGWTSRTAPQAVWRGVAHSPTDVWLLGIVGNLHFDGTAFRVLESGGAADRSVPLGTATEMFTFTDQMARWTGGASATPVRTPIFFDAWSWWQSPSGRVFAAGNGLLVHAPAPPP